MNRSGSYQRNQGFTLLELQVALVLVVIVATLLTGALFISLQTWQKVNERQNDMEQDHLLLSFLRRHLGNSQFNHLSTQESQRQVLSFFGTSDQLYFVSTFPGANNDGELYWWHLKLVEEEKTGTRKPVLYYLPFTEDQVVEFSNSGDLYLQGVSDDGEQAAAPLQQMSSGDFLDLQQQINWLEIDYFLLEKERDGTLVEADWVSEWLGERFPPQLIRIRMAITDPELDLLPELVINPRLASVRLYGEPQ